MKKLLLISSAALFLATSAQAQQFIGGSRYNYGNTHGGYVSSSITLTSKDTACIRANYASTFALQRCADQMGTRISTKRARR